MSETPLYNATYDARKVAAGDTIFRAGDRSDDMYLVASGEVDIVAGDDVLVERIGAGGFFGELALIDHAPRGATAIAHTDASVVPVGRLRFEYLVREHPGFAIDVMTAMVRRMRTTR